MTHCVFHPEALREYAAAGIRYARISPEIGDAFLKEVEDSVEAITNNPETWRIVEENVRVFWLQRFPFGIYFLTEKNSVEILAVTHTSRKPGYWKNRI